MITTKPDALSTCLDAAGKTFTVMRRELIAAYEYIDEGFENGSLTLTDVVDGIFKTIDPAQGNAREYHKATQVIAGAIDAEENAGMGNAYHNPAHFAKAMVSSQVLAGMHNRLSYKATVPKVQPEGYAQLAFEMAAHDFGHDGTGNTVKGEHIPFRLEEGAIGKAEQLLREKNIPQDIIDRLDMIRATDVSGVNQPSHETARHYAALMKGRRFAAPDKMEFLGRKENIVLSALMVDADVLPSVISKERCMIEGQRVADEIGYKMSAGSQLFFLEKIVRGQLATVGGQTLTSIPIRDMMTDFKSELEPATPVPPQPVQRPSAVTSLRI